MTSYPNSDSVTLSHSHRRMLFEQSGISPDVAEERGYYTARKRSEIPEAFKDYQRRRGLVIPTYSPDGATRGYQLRPEKPIKRRNGNTPKYESPGESGVIVDVHPRARHAVRYGDGDLYVVEGVKKADALLSQGALAVALTGVWMAHVPKSNPKQLLPCWDHIRLQDRRVFLCFDSDWRRNEGVHDALKWLVGALEGRGSDVRVAYLEDAPDGSKVGADDYLARGRTVAELKALCRRFEEQDVARIRLSKDEELRARARDLDRRFWTTQWVGRGGATTRDVYLKLIEATKRAGKIHPDGLRVIKAQGPLALEAKISTRTLWRALDRLEGMGLGYRDNEGRKRDKSGAFVLICDSSATRARVSHIDDKGADGRESGQTAQREKATGELQGCDLGDLPSRTPRLRWAQPAWKPPRETFEKYRKGEISLLPRTRERIERLGKRRGAVVDALEVAGGTLLLAEICTILDHKRARDLVRVKNPEKPKSRDGMLWALVDAGVITIRAEISTRDIVVSLTDRWFDALDNERLRGHEVEAEEIARTRYVLKSRAFHNKDKKPKESRGTEAGRRNVEESHKKRDGHVEEGPKTSSVQEAKIRKLVQAGMKESFARESVLKLPSTVFKPRRAGRQMPEKVGGVYVHAGECECEWCAA